MYIPYSAVPDRLPLRRGSTRIIVWTVLNIENWLLSDHMPRRVLPPPMDGRTLPDRANWAWHEYGMRVGFWRLRELFDRFEIKVTLAINGSVCSEYPRIAEAAMNSNWEFIGHGFTQVPMSNLDNEEETIRQTLEAIRSTTGVRPRGWESPGLTGTAITLDLLAKVGLDYVADLTLDDQPCDLSTELALS